MKRKWAVLLATIMAVGSLAGCGSSKGDAASNNVTPENNIGNTESGAKAITIDFWNSWTGSDGETLIAKVDEFNKTNPYGITVNMDISSSFAEKLSTSLPTGEAAPLVLLGAADRFGYQEYLLDINDIWENTSIEILPTRGLCSYYAERGGLIVSY